MSVEGLSYRLEITVFIHQVVQMSVVQPTLKSDESGR